MREMSDYLGHDKGAPDREVKPVPTDGHTAPALCTQCSQASRGRFHSRVMPRFLQQALQDQLPRTGSAARAQTSPRRRVRVQAMGAPGPIHATCAGASGANERPRPFPRAGALFASEHRPWSSPLPRPGHGRVDILRRRGHDKTALKRLYDRRAAVERAKRCHLARALSHGRRTQLHQGLRSPLERGVLRQGGRDPRARVEPREAHHTSPRAATLRPSWTLGLSRS